MKNKLIKWLGGYTQESVERLMDSQVMLMDALCLNFILSNGFRIRDGYFVTEDADEIVTKGIVVIVKDVTVKRIFAERVAIAPWVRNARLKRSGDCWSVINIARR